VALEIFSADQALGFVLGGFLNIFIVIGASNHPNRKKTFSKFGLGSSSKTIGCVNSGIPHVFLGLLSMGTTG